MNETMKSYLFLISALLITTHLKAEETQVVTDPISSGLEDLKKTGSLIALKPALDAIDKKNEKLSAREKLESYLEFVNRIMTVYDPKFDTNPPEAFLNLTPGPGPIPGRGITSGMDPKDIPDKKVREDYEHALSENAKNIKFTTVQIVVRRVLADLGKRYSATLKSPELGNADRADAIEKIKKTSLPAVLKDKFISDQEAVKPQSPSVKTSK